MNPASLYAAYVSLTGGDIFERQAIRERVRWQLVALEAAGMVAERVDGALDRIARDVDRASAAGLTPPISASGPRPENGPDHEPVSVLAYWTLRLWSRMAGARPNGLGLMQLHAGEATAQAMQAALASLANRPGFELLEHAAPGERASISLAEAVVHLQRVAGIVATLGPARPLLTAERGPVVATLRRIALCYDAIHDELPMGPALRCAANLLDQAGAP
jgi:hypothetical protein